MSDPIRNAVGEVLRSASNFPEKVQRHLLGQDMGPLIEKVTGAVAAALAVHPPRVSDAEQRYPMPDLGDYETQTGWVIAVMKTEGKRQGYLDALAERPEPGWEYGQGIVWDDDGLLYVGKSFGSDPSRALDEGYVRVRRVRGPWQVVTRSESEGGS